MFGLGRKTRIADRYVLGGESLRGFEAGGVGPHDTVTKDPLGGQQFYAAGFEVTFPIGLPNELGVKGALFSDTGSVWQSKLTGPNLIDKPSLRVSAGAGLRWKSPMGPIKIDFAEAILKEKSDRTQFVLFGFSSRF
ncbi:outer membrane protein assembly factor BamA precursor [Caedimonas varicaedens]|nr:outer membrane protein assembly factor BamA precursor [Caedimonas varicaedens]